MSKIGANLKPNPKEWNLVGCQEYLMKLEVPCPGWDAGYLNAEKQGHLLSCDCGATGKVYPLRERHGPSWHHQPCPIPDTCDCRGQAWQPVEPHLETLRAAALGAGYWHETAHARAGYGHCFHPAREPVPGGLWLWGTDDLLTAYRALCLALRKEASDA